MAGIASTPTATQAVTWQPAKLWLNDVYNPAINQEIKADASVQFKIPVMAGTFYPRGQKFAVIVNDPLKKGREFSLTIWVMSEFVETVLDLILQPGRLLLIQDVIGINYYCKMSGEITREQIQGADSTGGLPRRWLYKWTIPFIEQASPAAVSGI